MNNTLTYAGDDTKVIHCSASVCLTSTYSAKSNPIGLNVSKPFLLRDVLILWWGMCLRTCRQLKAVYTLTDACDPSCFSLTRCCNWPLCFSLTRQFTTDKRDIKHIGCFSSRSQPQNVHRNSTWKPQPIHQAHEAGAREHLLLRRWNVTNKYNYLKILLGRPCRTSDDKYKGD